MSRLRVCVCGEESCQSPGRSGTTAPFFFPRSGWSAPGGGGVVSSTPWTTDSRHPPVSHLCPGDRAAAFFLSWLRYCAGQANYLFKLHNSKTICSDMLVAKLCSNFVLHQAFQLLSGSFLCGLTTILQHHEIV